MTAQNQNIDIYNDDHFCPVKLYRYETSAPLILHPNYMFVLSNLGSNISEEKACRLAIDYEKHQNSEIFIAQILPNLINIDYRDLADKLMLNYHIDDFYVLMTIPQLKGEKRPYSN